MNERKTKYDVGVIVGRFQIYKLHAEHKNLISTVIGNHPKVLLFLGLSPCKTSFNNPLDFQARKQMILEEFPADKYPNLNILYIKDEANDDVWSKKLDTQIRDLTGPNQTVGLYGGRDSFIPHYTGKFPTIELEPGAYMSATELRNITSKTTRPTEDFRAGVIWATGNKFPINYPTVDIAIIDWNANRVLLARKPNEKLYRFVGGFADPASDSYETDARREVMEETHVSVDDLVYIGSKKVDDWRYRSELDKIKTMLFAATYQFGIPQADDDIAEVKWFNLGSIESEDLVETHRPLLEMFNNWLGKRRVATAGVH